MRRKIITSGENSEREDVTGEKYVYGTLLWVVDMERDSYL
jgi:hypothetical protein